MIKKDTLLFLIASICAGLLQSTAVYAQEDTVKKRPAFEQQDVSDWLVQQKVIKRKPESNSFFMMMGFYKSRKINRIYEFLFEL